MDFALSEEQQFLQQTVKDLLRDQCRLDVVREDVANNRTKNERLYKDLAQLGVQGALIPEEYGGTGLRLLDIALISEALGGSVATVPFVGSCVMAPLAIELAGSDEQKNSWLPRIASGEVSCGIAISEHTGARDHEPISSNGSSLSGRGMFVLEVEDADLYLVATASKELHLVYAHETELTQLSTIDQTRSVGEIRLNQSLSDPLTSATNTESALNAVIDAVESR